MGWRAPRGGPVAWWVVGGVLILYVHWVAVGAWCYVCGVVYWGCWYVCVAGFIVGGCDPMGLEGIRLGSMGLDGTRWDSVGLDGIRWGSMGFDGIRWDSIGLDGVLWISMGFDGVRWGSMGFGGIMWGSM